MARVLDTFLDAARQDMDVVDHELDVTRVAEDPGEQGDADTDSDQDEQAGQIVPKGWAREPLEQVHRSDESGAGQTSAHTHYQHHGQETPVGRDQGFDQQPPSHHVNLS